MLSWRILPVRKEIWLHQFRRFFKTEKDLGEAIKVHDVVARTAEACSVSESTVVRCMRHSESSGSHYRFSPRGGKPASVQTKTGRPKITVDEFTTGAIRRIVHSFFRNGEHPTVDKVFVRSKEDIADLPKMGRTSFWKLLKDIGFRYKKTKGNREIMMEKSDIVAKRHRYLREIRELTASGRPIVFLDETWVNANHTVLSRWYDDVSGGRDSVPKEAPTGKGKRLIVLHAGYRGGFLPECACVFIGKTNSADYHDEMNGTHFEEWFENSLLPNLPAGSAIVMDNAPYHTVKCPESVAPTSSWRKAEMQAWLTERKVPWTTDMLKAELYEIVKRNKPAVQYVVDNMALQQGFVVVRLPPYHCILNPIELIWAWVKGKVAELNKTFKIRDVQTLTMEAIEAVTPAQWSEACRHCEDLVEEFWKSDGMQEIQVERLVIDSSADSSDSSDDCDSDTEYI